MSRPDRVAALSPALAPLWLAVHHRLSSGHRVMRVRVGPLDTDQRTAVADLLGSARAPGSYVTIALPRLDEVVRDATGLTTHDVVARLVGPIGDRAADRRRAVGERAELWEWCRAHPTVAAQPALADWAMSVQRGGLIGGSVARTRGEMERALLVLAALPATGLPLPVFADAVLTETHALDDGTRLATLVLKALAAIYGTAPPADAQDRRALWGRAGIVDDELSSTVLAAGLRMGGSDTVARILRICGAAGQAAVLTLAQLRGSRCTTAPADVWIVENPSILAVALARFGRRCPPIVCTAGWPSGAGVLLLQLLAGGNARLHYHGDLDGEGLRIAANIVARTGAIPWRMSSADYLDAVGDGPPVGRVTPVPWDADLADHLRERGATVSEERVVDRLLADMRST